MTAQPRRLTFSAVDGLGFAATSGRLDAAEKFAPYLPNTLGPLLELFVLVSGGHLPYPRTGSWIAQDGAVPGLSALQEGRELWIKPSDRSSGFTRAIRAGSNGNSRLIAFLMDAKRAAQDITRLPGTTPGQLIAAMEEMESNIHEHSDAPATGLIAFRAVPEMFEFVVLDGGIGVLESLRRCSTYAALGDHGRALETALTDGTSRFGPGSNHGHGFRPIFLGLANLRGSLRFRSGDYGLTMDGTSPNLTTAQLAQKPPVKGFFASITCYPPL
jgi:hypothetical protein